MSITDIQDARAMKRMGAPLNTPVEHRKFDRAVSKHFMALAKAENGFDKAFYEYIDGRGAGTLAKFNLMKRRSESLYKAAIGAQTFAENFSKDPAQKQIITLLVRNALVAVEYWREAIDACEEGSELQITLGEVPRLFSLED